MREVGLTPIYGSKKPIKQPEQIHYNDRQTIEEMWNRILKHQYNEEQEENQAQKINTPDVVPEVQNEDQKAIIDIILKGAE